MTLFLRLQKWWHWALRCKQQLIVSKRHRSSRQWRCKKVWSITLWKAQQVAHSLLKVALFQQSCLNWRLWSKRFAFKDLKNTYNAMEVLIHKALKLIKNFSVVILSMVIIQTQILMSQCILESSMAMDFRRKSTKVPCSKRDKGCQMPTTCFQRVKTDQSYKSRTMWSFSLPEQVKRVRITLCWGVRTTVLTYRWTLLILVVDKASTRPMEASLCRRLTASKVNRLKWSWTEAYQGRPSLARCMLPLKNSLWPMGGSPRVLRAEAWTLKVVLGRAAKTMDTITMRTLAELRVWPSTRRRAARTWIWRRSSSSMARGKEREPDGNARVNNNF